MCFFFSLFLFFLLLIFLLSSTLPYELLRQGEGSWVLFCFCSVSVSVRSCSVSVSRPPSTPSRTSSSSRSLWVECNWSVRPLHIKGTRDAYAAYAPSREIWPEESQPSGNAATICGVSTGRQCPCPHPRKCHHAPSDTGSCARPGHSRSGLSPPTY